VKSGTELPKLIEGSRCNLRPPAERDIGHWAQAFRDDPDLGPAWGIEEDPDEAVLSARVEGAAKRAAAGGGLELAIADRESDELLGTVVLHSLDERHEHAEVGFWVLESARGRGVGTEAVGLMVDFAFSALGAHRVEMITLPALPHIEPVRALARRLGFTEEGVLRQRNFERGRRHHVLMLAVLEDDWRFPPPDAPG
jgi:RimJ/RimL family protein N-acetyltransferase